jgi:hypothetical protein
LSAGNEYEVAATQNAKRSFEPETAGRASGLSSATGAEIRTAKDLIESQTGITSSAAPANRTTSLSSGGKEDSSGERRRTAAKVNCFAARQSSGTENNRAA